MPRRHRSARERPPPEPPRAPGWVPPPDVHVEGFTVRRVSREKAYRCPGCEQEIPPGTAHLVVFREEEADLRRHWHTPCWRREVRLGRRPP